MSTLDQLDSMVYIGLEKAAIMAGASNATIRRRIKDCGMKIVEINGRHFLMAKEFKSFMKENPVVTQQRA